MKEKLRSHILNLYMMALSDGYFAPEELEVILKIAQDKGISKEEFEEIISHPTGVEFHLPDTFMDKIKLLFDFVKVILADGVIENDEIDMFMRFCKRFQFADDESRELFDWLVQLAKKELSTDLIEEEIQNLLKS